MPCSECDYQGAWQCAEHHAAAIRESYDEAYRILFGLWTRDEIDDAESKKLVTTIDLLCEAWVESPGANPEDSE